MLTRTDFVGRGPELSALAELLAAALSGQPRLVVCLGEPGVGKTRLTEEIVARARARGMLGVWGSADETLGSPPYWPWRQVLRALANAVDVAQIAREHGLTAELSRLAPQVFPSDDSPRTGQNTTEDRFRQFDAITQVLRQVSRRVPLAVVFDDAHWADEPSLLLLGHVARGLTDERLLILVNARESEPQHGEHLRRLAGVPAARQIHLGGLAEPDVRQHLALLLGRDVTPEEVAQVMARTGGNPFFVQEIGRVMAARSPVGTASVVTPHLRDSIAARLDRLSPTCRRALRAAAILGHEIPVPILATMLQLSPLACLALLDEAHRSGVVEPAATPDRYRFVHSLVRDAIEAGIDRTERVALHRQAADAVEQHYAAHLGPHLFDLARHWAEAAVQGEAATAARWIERAADEAMRQLAYEEAARLFREALRVGASHLGDADRCRLLLALGAALGLAGDLGGRLSACLEAAALARKLGRPDLLAEAALVMEPGGQPGFDIATRRLCQEALAALGPDSAALRARTAARFAETFIYLPDVDAAAEASAHALELAEQCRDPRALAAALRARRVVCAGPDGLATRAELAGRMLALGQETGDPRVELPALCWQIDVSFERGDLAGVATEIQALARCASEVGGPVARFTVLHTRAALAQAQARFVEARRLAAEAFATLAPTDHPARFHTRAGLLGLVGRHVGQDAASVSANTWEDAPTETREHAGLIATISRAHTLVTAGMLDEAASAYRALGPVDGWRPPPHVVLLSYSLGIAVAAALEAPDDVPILRDALAPFRGHHVVSGIGAVAYFGPVELWLGVAARHLGRLDEAVADLEQAERICARTGAAGFQVEAQYELAAALALRAASGDVSRAHRLLAPAERQAARLGMAPYSENIATLRTMLKPHDRLPLSARELEVARLVAEGLTNREIAGRLVLSERTAQNHVQHILAKLQLANRAQVARLIAARNEYLAE